MSRAFVNIAFLMMGLLVLGLVGRFSAHRSAADSNAVAELTVGAPGAAWPEETAPALQDARFVLPDDG